MKKLLGFIQANGILSGLGGVILTIILGLCTTPAIISTHYVSVDNFDMLVDTYFVKTGLVSEDILTLDLDKQLETIASNYSSAKYEFDKCRKDLNDILIDNKLENVRKDMSWQEMFVIIRDKASGSESKEDTIASLEKRIEELEAQTSAEVLSVGLIVDGEQINTSIPNSVAIINEHIFYSETLLNSFLDEQISYGALKTTVYYGSERAEKIAFPSTMITDIEGFDVYAVGSGKSFKMGTNIYDNGLVTRSYADSQFYAHLKGEYSKMSFVVGHIDGSDFDNATIYVYTKKGNDEYRLLDSYNLTHDMFPEEKVLNINYADGIQIVVDAPFSSNYALADMYLYR